MGGGELVRQLFAQRWPLVLTPRLHLDLDRDLVADIVTPDVDLELVNGVVFANERLDRAWVDIGAANELHVVPAASDATLIDVTGAAAVAGGIGNFQYHVFGAIAQHGNETAPERGHDPLAQFTVWHRLARLGIDDLFDEMVLDDMRSARLVRALEDHDGAQFRHARGIANLCAPRLCQLPLD